MTPEEYEEQVTVLRKQMDAEKAQLRARVVAACVHEFKVPEYYSVCKRCECYGEAIVTAALNEYTKEEIEIIRDFAMDIKGKRR